MRRRRSTVVFVEAALAVVATGIVVGTPVGYVVAGAAAVAGIAGVVRRRGRGLADVAADRLRDPVAPVLPDLHVVDVPTRAGDLGVAGDGQGFVVVLDAGTLAAWSLADVLDLTLGDPARPAAVQVVVEQRGLAGSGVDARSGPARTYRSLPVGGLPLWSRVLLAIRHEPAWAPEAVEARGGGATGARNALAAAAARAAARAAGDGIRLRALGADELVGVLRGLAPDPALDPAADVVLGVPLGDDDALGAVLRTLAALDVARAVVSASASVVDRTLSALVRIVDPRAGVAGQAAERLVADRLATALPGSRDDDVLATLPLGGGGASLTHVVAQERR
jgi:type VII ESX secretion system EccE translocon-like protein